MVPIWLKKMCIWWRVENIEAFDGISCYCCSWQPIPQYLFFLFSSKHGSSCMVHPRLGRPVSLPCCFSFSAGCWLGHGERRENTALTALFSVSLWSMEFTGEPGGRMTDGTQIHCDEQASSCRSCKPRGHEVRKSSNQVITVLFLFLPIVRAAGKARGSFRMSDSTLCFSHGHMPFLCHPNCTRELGNEKFVAWKTHPT